MIAYKLTLYLHYFCLNGSCVGILIENVFKFDLKSSYFSNKYISIFGSFQVNS